MSKFLGFLLGVVVALAGPAVFGVLAAPGGIELNAKKMALAFGIGALIFWAVVSYFSGAGALGAFLAFGALIYCWLWIPNRTTNFLNDVPGVTNGMIDGSKQYTLNGVVPILAVISLVYSIQLITRGVQRRRRERAEDERLQREQEAAQAQQEADVAAVYPVAGSTYQAPPPYESHSRYDDLFDEPEPESQPVQPRSQADEQTAQYPIREVGTAEAEQTALFPQEGARSNEADDEHGYEGDETMIAPAPTTQAQEPEAPAAERTPAGEETQPVEQAQPVEEAQPVADATPVREPEARAAEQAPAAEETQPVEQAQPVEEAQPVADATPVREPEARAAEQAQAAEETRPVEQAQPVQETQPVAEASPVQESQPIDETRPVAETKPIEDPQPGAEAAPVKESQPAEETKPLEDTQPVQQTQPVEAPKPVEETEAVEETKPFPVGQGEKKVSPKEEMGSQYRERMENPEDTGEFHMAFENPVVKPA